MTRASKNLQNIVSEMPDDPVCSGPNGEKVGVPYLEEEFKRAFGVLWCFVRRFMPKVHGLPRDVVPLPSYEREQLLARLAGNWKIQPLQGAGNAPASPPPITYEDLFVSGDKMIMSGGMHNARTGHGSHRHVTARANETAETRIVPFRGKNHGTLYLDQIGSRVVRESDDGGEIEVDNAMGYRILLQREWKRQGLSPPPAASAAAASTPPDAGDAYLTSPLNPAVAVATPVVDGGGGRDIPGEIAQLQQLRDRGVLTEEEFSNAKVRLLGQWTGSGA